MGNGSMGQQCGMGYFKGLETDEEKNPMDNSLQAPDKTKGT